MLSPHGVRGVRGVRDDGRRQDESVSVGRRRRFRGIAFVYIGGRKFLVQGEVKSGFFIVEYKVVGKYEIGFWGDSVGFVVVACAHYCVGSAVAAAVEVRSEGSCGSCVAHKWKITVIWVTDVTHQVGWSTRDQYGSHKNFARDSPLVKRGDIARTSNPSIYTGGVGR